jgi:BON domain
MNAKDNQKSTRLIHREYKDSEGNLCTEYKDSQGNIYTEYRDSLGNFHSDKNGYIDGKLAEAHIQDVRVDRADKNTSKGLLIGVIVTTVVGLTTGVIYFLNDLKNPQPVSVVSVPTYKTDPKPNSTPEQVKVVEKEVVKIVQVPVPVPTPEAKSNQSTVNITVKPSESNLAPKQGNTNAPAVKPPQKPSVSAPKPAAIPSSNNNVTSATPAKTDGDLKNEILMQFKNNLPNNQLKVDVKNGAVAVSGNVETQEQMQQIQPLLNSIQGIKKLDVTASIANGVTE